jgi:small GTP-binding protein
MNELVAKIVIVGEYAVGKTSLLNAFLEKSSDGDPPPTVVPDCKRRKVKTTTGDEILVDFWDTAGQEQYQSISQMFYREAHVAFVCFDCLDASTVPIWVSRVRDFVPSCLIFLVATKADLISESSHLQILTRESLELAEEYDAAFFLTSALTEQGVSELFHGAARAGLKLFERKEPINASLDLIPAEGKARCC